MNLQQALYNLPKTNNKVVSVLSGGLDSGIMTMVLVEKYGSDNVHAISFDYNQKQIYELDRARSLCVSLGIKHKRFDLGVLGDIAKPLSANISDTDVDMPTIHDVLGDPQPVTYVPFRNAILLSLALSYAEVVSANYVFTGVQSTDQYGYWDTTQAFIDSVNNIASQNRTHQVEILAPWAELSKYEEIEICKELDQIDLLKHTLTCYNPGEFGISCGVCPSCSERIAAFKKAGIEDPVDYV